jgi:Protein of unknown function (DUF2934)
MPKKPSSPADVSASGTGPVRGGRRRTADVPSEASDRSPVTQTAATTSEEVLAQASGQGAAVSAQPTYDDIANAAYQRYLSRGGSDGRDLEDWIEAERELRQRHR